MSGTQCSDSVILVHLLHPSYIVFICYHPVVRKVAAIRIVAVTENSAGDVVHLARAAVALARCLATTFDQFRDGYWCWFVETQDWGHTRPGQASIHFPLEAIGMGEVLHSFFPS